VAPSDQHLVLSSLIDHASMEVTLAESVMKP